MHYTSRYQSPLGEILLAADNIGQCQKASRVAEPFGAAANAVSIPPGEYVRKNETQRN